MVEGSTGSGTYPASTARRGRCALLLALLLGAGEGAMAASFNFKVPFTEDTTIDAASNTAFISGVAIRTDSRDARLVGKSHLDPNVCGRSADGTLYFQSCQGLFRTQTFPAERIAAAPGFASNNFDQGNLNYEKGDIVQSGFRLNQNFNFTLNDFGVFIKGFAFYDPVNANFREYKPNLITRDNFQQVGFVSTPGRELIRTGGLTPTLGTLTPLVSGLGLDGNIVGQLLANPTAIPGLGVRNDSTPCPANRNPSGGPCGIVYGPGGEVYTKRTDFRTLQQIGKGYQLQDFNFYGAIPLPLIDRKLQFKIGRQQVQWGEATVEFFDSLNVANPVNLNNFFRLGSNGLDDFYTPTNMLSLSTNLFEGASISGWYALEYKPLIAPAAGGFFSPVNVATQNGGPQSATIGFGSLADDPDAVGILLDSPLTVITNTSSRVQRLPDREPSAFTQFGLQAKYYADWLNNGTELGLYFAQYHSRLPFVSFLSTDLACGKNSGSLAELVATCPDLPILNGFTDPNNPQGATDDSVPFDTAKVFLEYPERIQMYGLSFNTTVGQVAFQGEVAYRPRDPLQVAIVDLAFGAFGPTLNNCDKPPGCPLGMNPGTGSFGVNPDGSVGTYPTSRFVVDAAGTPGAYNDTVFGIVGEVPGSARSFPSFVIPYRGGELGSNDPNSYIQGFEYQKTLSINLGGTYVQGNTELIPRLIGADQAILLFELGARVVPEMPSLEVLQFEAPGVQYHASAGADGTGADRSRQACSTNQACSFGPDGLRFNPSQQDRDFYPNKFSGGYAVVALIRYESVAPGISIQPQIIFKHDVYGTSPGLASNYIEGRILWDTLLEVRYRSNLSANFGYQFFSGGGIANQLRDRDSARFFVKYAF